MATQRLTGQVRDSETGVDYFNARYFTASLGRFNSPDPGNAGADPTDPQTWNGYAYVRGNPLNSVDPGGACDVAIYGIRMNPGDSTPVTNFSADKIVVFPYEGTNIATGVGQVIGGGGDVNAAVQGVRSAIAQTPAGQSVNIFAFSGGAQTLASAWGGLTSAEQGRIGNITYSIPGSLSGSLPSGSSNPTMIFPNGSAEVPSGAPRWPYNIAWSTSCGHDVNCILKTQAALLQQRFGSSCSTPQVLPAPQPKANSGAKGGGGGGGTATSTITYGPPCNEFDWWALWVNAPLLVPLIPIM